MKYLNYFCVGFQKTTNMTNIDLTSGTFITLASCIIMLIIQLYYFLCPYSRIYRYNKKQSKQENDNENYPPISVIIVTKDSGSMLKENLPFILEQDYPKFEVIVVNDESAGEDEDILKILGNQYPHLYRTFIPKSARYVSKKKLGIAMGIKASKYEWIVMTEPYCKPVSSQWLKSLAKHFSPDTDIVLGYCNYNENKGFFAKRIISDMVLVSMRFLGRAIKGKPYMGIGKNMAYRKDIYQRHHGFHNQLPLLRGDDDLFINEIANKQNTKVAVEQNSIMRMPLPEYKKDWIADKIGYEVTGSHYKGTSRLSNSLETWTAFLFNILVIVSLFTNIFRQDWILTVLILIIWLTRTIIMMTVFHKTSKVLGENLSTYFFIYDIMRPFYSLSLKIGYITRCKGDYMRK